jgi:hypothetical protein
MAHRVAGALRITDALIDKNNAHTTTSTISDLSESETAQLWQLNAFIKSEQQHLAGDIGVFHARKTKHKTEGNESACTLARKHIGCWPVLITGCTEKSRSWLQMSSRRLSAAAPAQPLNLTVCLLRHFERVRIRQKRLPCLLKSPLSRLSCKASPMPSRQQGLIRPKTLRWPSRKACEMQCAQIEPGFERQCAVVRAALTTSPPLPLPAMHRHVARTATLPGSARIRPTQFRLIDPVVPAAIAIVGICGAGQCGQPGRGAQGKNQHHAVRLKTVCILMHDRLKRANNDQPYRKLIPANNCKRSRQETGGRKWESNPPDLRCRSHRI